MKTKQKLSKNETCEYLRKYLYKKGQKKNEWKTSKKKDNGKHDNNFVVVWKCKIHSDRVLFIHSWGHMTSAAKNVLLKCANMNRRQASPRQTSPNI